MKYERNFSCWHKKLVKTFLNVWSSLGMAGNKDLRREWVCREKKTRRKKIFASVSIIDCRFLFQKKPQSIFLYLPQRHTPRNIISNQEHAWKYIFVFVDFLTKITNWTNEWRHELSLYPPKLTHCYEENVLISQTCFVNARSVKEREWCWQISCNQTKDPRMNVAGEHDFLSNKSLCLCWNVNETNYCNLQQAAYHNWAKFKRKLDT